MSRWDEVYKDPKYCIKEPAEEVVKFLSYLQESKAVKVLDLGFGAGRHVIYLKSHGFDVYGTDISKVGMEITENWLSSEGMKAELKISDMTIIPYKDNFFDGCISRGVITHNTIDNIEKSIGEIYRTLKNNAYVMLTFISKESSLFKKGKEIEQNTYVYDQGTDAGVPHHFVDRNEVETMMQKHGFDLIDLYHMKHSGLIDVGRPYISAHWIYVGRKLT